jgi:VWFA-related protein
VVFNEQVRYGLPDGVLFTGSGAQVLAGLSRFPAGGRTALYDAVIAALDRLECATNQKRALVVLSDGSDNASRHTREEMFDRVRASDAIIYTVRERAGTRGPIGDTGVMKRLAELSGGVAYAARTEADVIASFSESGGNIRRGYRIGYVSTHGQDGRYHRVQVLVRAPGRSNLSARVRHGYTSHAGGCSP